MEQSKRKRKDAEYSLEDLQNVEKKLAAIGKKRQRRDLPVKSVQILKSWLMAPEHWNHPYPSEMEKKELMAQTGLDPKQLSTWFTNARKRHLNPLKEKHKSLLQKQRDAIKQTLDKTSESMWLKSNDTTVAMKSAGDGASASGGSNGTKAKHGLLQGGRYGGSKYTDSSTKDAVSIPADTTKDATPKDGAERETPQYASASNKVKYNNGYSKPQDIPRYNTVTTPRPYQAVTRVNFYDTKGCAMKKEVARDNHEYSTANLVQQMAADSARYSFPENPPNLAKQQSDRGYYHGALPARRTSHVQQGTPHEHKGPRFVRSQTLDMGHWSRSQMCMDDILENAGLPKSKYSQLRRMSYHQRMRASSSESEFPWPNHSRPS